MSQELLYTSAPEGLNPSEQGFCTVACTEGMPRNLKEFLENLSGYRQADQPPHPVNYSHLIHSVGGKRYQVLSRVSDYEKDYSGRTNKLAHHVALTIEELPSCGPAALLANSVCQSIWDGETGWIEGGPILPVASAYQGPCTRWEAVTGDAGWAGILAEAAADGSNRPMYVIFPPGEDTLQLVSEALGVLPREKAWTTSFSTYFTKLPAGVDCLWRFVLDGSPEARQVRSAGHGRVIDLVELGRSRRRAPDGNPFVQAAREGKILEAASVFSPRFTSSTTSGTPADSARLPRESASPTSPFSRTPATPASPFDSSKGQGNTSSKLIIAIAGLAAVLLIGVGTLVYSMLTKDIPKPIDRDLLAKDDKQKTRKTTTREFLPPDEEPRPENAIETSSMVEIKPKEVAIRPIVDPGPRLPDPQSEIPKPWDQSLKMLGGHLKLPERRPSLTAVPEESKAAVLAEIHVADPAEIDLTILSAAGSSKEIGKEGSKLEGFILEPPDEADEDDSIRQWVVKRQSFLPLIPTPRKEEVGTFTLSDQKLSFAWNMQANLKTTKSLSLSYCLLQVSREDKILEFQLSEPKLAEPLRYDLSMPDQKLFLGAVSTSAVNDPKALFVELRLEAPGFGSPPMQTIRKGETATFKAGDGIEMDLAFAYDSKGPHFQVNTFTVRPVLVFVTPASERPPEVMESVPPGRRERIEQIEIQEMRLPASKSDFERLPKRAKAINDTLGKSGRWFDAVKEAARYQKLIEAEENPNKRKELESKQRPHLELDAEYRRRADAASGYVTWCEKMKPRFDAIAESAQIYYSVYTLIDGKKVYLAKAKMNPPGQKGVGENGPRGQQEAKQSKGAKEKADREKRGKPEAKKEKEPMEEVENK